MGEKLKFDPEDPFFAEFSPNPKGISGGCYCCSKQIHIEFDSMGVLPVAKINSDPYQILICDDCENDINFLEKTFLEPVDFDTLYFMQEDINSELIKLATPMTVIDEDLRKKCLTKVYKKFKNNLKGKLP